MEFCQHLFVNIQLTAKDCDFDCTLVDQSVNLTNLSYTFSEKLEACRAYKLKLSKDQILQEGNFVEEFEAREEFVKIQATVEEQIDPIALKVSWVDTKFPYCEKNFFKVEVRQNNKEILQVETSNSYQTIYNLEPCEDYVVSVYPLSQGESMIEFGDSLNHTMASMEPSGIRSLSTTYDEIAFSIKIDWQPPEFGSKCVKEYELKIESEFDNRTKNINTTSENFLNVLACVSYRVKINSWTIDNLKAAEVVQDYEIPSRGAYNFSCARQQ